MHHISYIYTARTKLQCVSVKIYHHQGVPCANIKSNCQWYFYSFMTCGMICSWHQLCIYGTHLRFELLRLKYSYKNFLYNNHNLCRTKLWSLLAVRTSVYGYARGDATLLQAYSAVLNPSGPCPYAGAGPYTGAPNVTVFCTNYICCIRNAYNYNSVWRIQTAHVYLIYTVDTNCRS